MAISSGKNVALDSPIEIIRLKDDLDVDYAMHDRIVEEQDKGWLAATGSRALLAFHGVLLVAIFLVFFIERCFNGP